MTDDHESDESNGGAIRTILTDLFESIAEMDERGERRRTGTGTTHSKNKRFDYGFTVGIGPQADDERAGTDEPSPDGTERAAVVHETDEGVVVTLDLPDVHPTDLSAGVDASARALVVGEDGTVIERVALPRGDLEVAGASFNNGVLDVRLGPTGVNDG